jgi:hypothetical protein
LESAALLGYLNYWSCLFFYEFKREVLMTEMRKYIRRCV